MAFNEAEVVIFAPRSDDCLSWSFLVCDIFVLFEINRSNTIRIKMQPDAEQSFRECFSNHSRYISIKFRSRSNDREMNFPFLRDSLSRFLPSTDKRLYQEII